jgi:hypothetical protein
MKFHLTKEDCMETRVSAQKSVMHKIMVLFMVLTPLVLTSCVIGTDRMIGQEVKPPIAPKADKAVLVIVRTTSMGFGVVIDNYIDGKMIGQTRGKSYFISNVKPGRHYLMAHAENIAVARLNFEAGRMYFFDQGIYPGFWKARTGLTPLAAKDALVQINESGCDYRIYDTKNPGEDLSAKDYQEAKDDFEKEVKEDPARHKDTLEYRGVSRL